jgi:hypothetical protein
MKRLLLGLLLVLLSSCTIQISLDGVSVVYLPTVPTGTPFFEPTPTQEVATPFPLRYVTNTTNVTYNIRGEPRIGGEDIGDMKPGEQLEFLFDVNTDMGWIGVAWEGGTAYVAKACCVERG